jgi:hypothetical protein
VFYVCVYFVYIFLCVYFCVCIFVCVFLCVYFLCTLCIFVYLVHFVYFVHYVFCMQDMWGVYVVYSRMYRRLWRYVRVMKRVQQDVWVCEKASTINIGLLDSFKLIIFTFSDFISELSNSIMLSIFLFCYSNSITNTSICSQNWLIT